MTISYKQTPIKSTNVRLNLDFRQRFIKFFFSFIWLVSSALSRLIIQRLFFRPLVYTLSENQKRILSKAKVFYFQSNVEVGNDKILKAYQWGKGPAVVFIHGWAGRGIQFSRYISSLTQAGFSVLTFDHIGHGESDGKTANYFRFSNAVYDFLETRPQLDVHTIVAHSLGASAVINYLWRSKRKINTILIAPALNLIEMLNVTFERYGVPIAAFNALIDEIEVNSGRSFALENPIDLLSKVTQNILIVHDTKDKAVPYEESWNASLLQNNISLFPTNGLGHIRILEDESLIAHLVKRIESGPMTHF
ncbi:MAG: lysophospholipase [Desulfobacula sp.]|nr:lysophospholipase [Desulfobacula sp.]